MSIAFDVLARELEAWHAEDRQATLWWRDDDAERDSPQLRELLAIANAHRVPIAIAAIPAGADRTLAAAIADCPPASVVQHGYAHVNHAPAGERSAELGAHRNVAERVAELDRGGETLRTLFAHRFVPVLVPPWNRIADDLVGALPDAKLRGLSCFGARAAREPAFGVVQANTHVDLIAWRRDRRFIGAAAALSRLAEQLRVRREGEADASEPTGILTHHLVCDNDAFAFLDALCAFLRDHPAAAWLGVDAIFEALH
ncbi:MAG TPA: polysaccharide deacetylase family protein [Casimicrobiaceae bacterium]|nr:polysaccharide deacetylase family protein [Casimicrobiaceae bacterium]